MESCPPEVLEQIFLMACMDGGHAGCSLSAVSRYVRNVAAGVRYYSVTLRDQRQIAAFSTLAVNDQLGVRNLFLSLDERVDAAPKDVVLLARLLLSRVSQTLETLAIVLSLTIDISVPFVSEELRKLRDFTLVIPQQPSPFTRSGLREATACAHPSLRRIHMVTPHRILLETQHYGTYAPNLTHLRVSCGADELNYTHIKEAEQALEDISDALWGSMDPLPSTTVQFLLQIASPAESADPGLAVLRPYAGALQDRAERAGGERQLVILENAHFPTPYGQEDAYADWLDVLAGGDGCWSAKALAVAWLVP